jgi:hypothetical protein
MIYMAFCIMENGTCGVPLLWGRGPPVPTDAFLRWLNRKTWDERKIFDCLFKTSLQATWS